MKFLVLALFVAAAVAAPVPEDDNSDAVDLIVNGVPEGAALELGGIVDMHLKEHVNGQLVASTNLLHPFTAAGLAEAAEQNKPSPIQIVENPESDQQILPDGIQLPGPAEPDFIPAPIVMPSPETPEVIPEAIVMPDPVAPEVIPEAIVLPEPVAPEVIPEAIVMPEPITPDVIPEAIVMPESIPPMVIPEVPEPIPEPNPEPIPEPSAQGPEEIYNDGLVQVQVNAPQDSGMFSTLQDWFSLVVNYISNGIQTSQQIV